MILLDFMSLFQSNCSLNPNLIQAYLTTKINLNPAKKSQILKLYPTLSTALEDNFQELRPSNPLWLKKFQAENYKTKIEQLQTNLINNDIQVLSSDDELYPKTLLALDNYPLQLYYQGNIGHLSNNLMLTVVGSRIVDDYAKIIMEQILSPICKMEVGIVSGLALGVDALSHQIAVDNNSWTIGVIGSGLDQKSFYPQQNLSLRRRIIENNGCVLSEYPPLFSANIYTFPQRNRILAALTDLTWVVQASLNSGSLITALKARDLGKTLATTPADIRNKAFAGNLKILKEGCSIITTPEDILGLLGLKIHPEIQTKSTVQFGSIEEQKIYQQLTIVPQNIESIAVKSKLSITEVSTNLTMLELNNLAYCTGSNEWIKVV